MLYQNIEINLENIAQLPEDDIPESIMSTMEQKISDEEVQSERVGYVPDPLSNLTDYTISDAIPMQNSSVLDVNGSFVSSDEIANYVLQKMKNNKTHQQMNSERVHLIPHSSKPVNEYYNPKLLVGLYPTLFCYGRGAPDDQSRPVKTNLREHIRYLLSYHDRRFETNHSFIFVVFHILQRRNACFHAQLITTKPYFRESAQDIQTLNSKDIETALENISKKTYNSESNSALNKLLNHIKTIGGRVMGSAYLRTALRTRIHSLIYNQCLPNIFMTLNPADIHSPVALYFAGVKLDLDNIQMEQLLNTYKRAEIIASHPVATAKFFHLLITNILETIIVDGVLGPIKAYFGTVESQGRGSLHLHLLIWLDHDMKPADIKEQVQNSTFREKLKVYLEDIIKEYLDEFKDKYVFESSDVSRSFNTPTQLSRDNIYAALRTIDLAGLEENTNEHGIQSTPTKERSSPSILYASPPNLYGSPPNLHGSPSIPYASPPNLHGSPTTSNGSSSRHTSLQTPTHGRSKSVDNVLHNQSNVIPACLPTPNPSSPNFASRFRADVVRVVEASNIHNHTDTCYKTIGGRVMGSAYSRTALRTRIHSLIYNQCLPNIFMTLNPADIHSPIALYFAGVKLDLDNIQIEQLLNTYKRAEIIASHPVATAKFFHLLITNILETIIVDGVLGPIKAYFGTVESQGRGSLHLHFLIWLDHDMKPADMSFNTPTQLSRDNIYTALRTIDLAGLEENTNEHGIQSTPTKERSSPSIPYASPPNLHASSSRHTSLQTPTHCRSKFDKLL
ncbi:unnamed protein product [Adineta steineri]|uniref:Helitron helicase-like domain-containing protein n=1 Tax=Adineta steineri TaxID=433720 RepID=A0A815FXC8_9BILA|nr:unnamed protein product [Adineta steineri]